MGDAKCFAYRRGAGEEVESIVDMQCIGLLCQCYPLPLFFLSWTSLTLHVASSRDGGWPRWGARQSQVTPMFSTIFSLAQARGVVLEVHLDQCTCSRSHARARLFWPHCRLNACGATYSITLPQRKNANATASSKERNSPPNHFWRRGLCLYGMTCGTLISLQCLLRGTVSFSSLNEPRTALTLLCESGCA